MTTTFTIKRWENVVRRVATTCEVTLDPTDALKALPVAERSAIEQDAQRRLTDTAAFIKVGRTGDLHFVEDLYWDQWYTLSWREGAWEYDGSEVNILSSRYEPQVEPFR